MNIDPKKFAIYLLTFLTMSAVGLLACYGWAEGIMYLDRVSKDPQHTGLAVGLSLGFLIPIGATFGAAGIAYVISDSL